MRDSRKVLAVLVAAASVLMSAASAYGAFPGTNGKIAYLELSSDGISRVHIINPDGSRETDISSAPASYSDFAPAWSPDGRTLAFSSNRDWIYQEIYTSNADGSNLTRITNDPAVKGGPSWSPDGTKIAYSGQCVGRQSGICVMNADGSGVTHIPNTDFRSSAGTWSPDGSKIAFLRKGDGGGDNIYTIALDGTELRQLTFLEENCQQNEPCSFAGPPDWSPDGGRLSFMIGTLFCSPNCATKADIYVINRDATGLTSLTNASYHDGYGDPAWSPDGTSIALVRGCTNVTCSTKPTSDLYVMKASGSELRQLTHDPEFQLQPDWQPVFENAVTFCRAELARLGESAFRARYGTNGNGSNAFGKCISANAKENH